MSEKITRDGDIITIKSEVTKVIDLSELRAELASYEQQVEPSDQEVLSWAKDGFVHPYYEDMRRAKEIREELEKWQSI
ncbi:MAG TPA: hypothetical protein PLT50_04175 [bacterium]|nr:hypothetical protein [bacterium]